MTKIELSAETEYIIQLGNIRLTASLFEGKTIVSAMAVENNDFIIIQPPTSNKIIIKSDTTIFR